jgi:membrane dipeptidase
MSIPVIDLHCDLTVYLIEKKDSSIFDTENIGCAIPHLKQGNVMGQVTAFFTPHEPIEHGMAMRQAKLYQNILNEHSDSLKNISSIKNESGKTGNKTVLLASIENASGLCQEDEKLDDGLKELDRIISVTNRIFYIGLLHWKDNRFGGAAGSDTGLKDDGKVLLEYISGKNITIDLSHSGDVLARDIFNYIDKKGLNILTIATHSNFRSLKNHKRNLTDELAREIISRKGLIGINFMSAYLGEDPNTIYDHIEFGLKLGGKNSLAFGADYFWDDQRKQEDIYHKEHISASTYPAILEQIENRISREFAEKIAYKNAKTFLEGIGLYF